MKPASRNTSKTVTTNCRSTATSEVAVIVISNIARNTLEIVKTQTAAVQGWQTSVHK